MQLVRFPALSDQWAVVDDNGVLRHVAGELSAWGPRLCGGEGIAALPRTGRTFSGKPGKSFPHKSIFFLSQSGGARIAAMVGVALSGRPNPFRSIVGYTLFGEDGPGEVLVTRDEFGDEPPALEEGLDAPALKLALQLLDQNYTLRPGDLVVLGRPLLEPAMRKRLAGPCSVATELEMPRTPRRPADPTAVEIQL